MLDLTKKQISNHIAKFDTSFDLLLYGSSSGDYVEISIGGVFKKSVYHPSTADSLLTSSNYGQNLNEYLTEIEFSFDGFNLFSDLLTVYQIKFTPKFSEPSTDKYFGIRAPNIF